MSNTKYALRATVFGYNDEFYNIYGSGNSGRITSIYETREAAMEAWKKLEHQIVEHQPLGSVLEGWVEFGLLSKERLHELNRLFFEQGRDLERKEYEEAYDEEEDDEEDEFYYEEFDEKADYISGCKWEDTIAKMSVDEAFELLTKAGLCSYNLIEYQADEKFYVAWLPEEQIYISDDLGCEDGDIICQGSSVAELWDACRNRSNYDDKFCKFTGTLEELSDSPEILRTLIQTYPDKIRYDEVLRCLSLESSYFDKLNLNVFSLVYPLLKNTPCEVREVTLEQLLEIQKSIYQDSRLSEEL